MLLGHRTSWFLPVFEVRWFSGEHINQTMKVKNRQDFPNITASIFSFSIYHEVWYRIGVHVMSGQLLNIYRDGCMSGSGYRALILMPSCLAALVFVLQLPALSLSAELFSTAQVCAFCHTSGNQALIDSRGNDLSIFRDWGSTMMANSFRDPLFRAKLESEEKRNPSLSGIIEDKCLTCHAPMARTQFRRDGNAVYTLAEAEHSDLAADGVSCTLCHQILSDALGEQESFSGGYMMDHRREIFGPYSQILAQPMLHHTGYLPRYGPQAGESELCATCHTLFTPYFNDDGTVAGTFPEQTPYLEWLNSDFSSAEQRRSCQDCHMPEIKEYIKITNRPPWYRVGQAPFWQHHFVGGNSFIIAMLAANDEALGAAAGQHQFDMTLKRVGQQLQERTAELDASIVEHDDNHILLDVRVTNKTGHKFPTGFPSRRAWLRVQVLDGRENSIFDSGKWNESGEILGEDKGYEPHYDVIAADDEVQIYEGVMADRNGTVTKTLLEAAAYVKDNRLVPAGFKKAGPMTAVTGPIGAVEGDNNFNGADNNQGSGDDIVSYRIALNGLPAPITVTASLLYQTVSPGFAEDLTSDDTPAVNRFAALYRVHRNQPLVIDSITVKSE